MKTLTSILIISLLMLSLNACSCGTKDKITAETTAVSTEAQTGRSPLQLLRCVTPAVLS